MKERASQIGAELDVASAPGQGTKVSVHVPLLRRGPLPPLKEGWSRSNGRSNSDSWNSLCDDHPLVRKGIAAILAIETDMKLVAGPAAAPRR
jgi:hypothetical protein